MERIKEAAGFTVITLLFSLLTWVMIDSYMDEYDLRSIQSEEVTIIEKVGAKGLFTPPVYYVRIRLPNGEEPGRLNRLSKNQMENSKIGDSLSGYMTGTATFSTARDIAIDSLYYLLAIIVFGILTFFCLVALIFSIPAVDRFERKMHSKRRVKSKKKWSVRKRAWRNAGIIVLFFLFISGRFVWNLIRKLQFVGKTETEATILDQFSHTTYRRYEDSQYELTISFKDQAGHTFEVLKDVTRHTYQQYGIGDKLPISYRNANTYDVFVPDHSIWDVAQAFTYWELYMYIILLAVSVFVVWAYLTDSE
ncbi:MULTISPECIES: hypothetical protein [unclassified Sporosarcina]|uniref:hypothetical protein n=1 Tax=unclassified Sporosarcina TaxID=2647733 RepID=UPI000C1642F0|nr:MULTISPECIES: hypothetical protein [unclassified Sporosarcina]PID04661.1 hypothetical protein CSV66_13795 [Sporosarcina sp. P30]PID07768.1 hypothetical protein CSV65_14235 [Sporosarcina sp. P31]PID11001.1 hypothetical protein CSV64_14030 [Sporosarcina sp. P32b]